MPTNAYEQNLDKNPANYAQLTPLVFLKRAARVYPDRLAVIHEPRSFTYRELDTRCVRLGSALQKRGIGVGDTVAILAPNIPEMLEAHYGVPSIGAVVNAINYRLDAAAIAFILDHGEAKVFFVDAEFAAVAKEALTLTQQAKPIVVAILDPAWKGETTPIGECDYETFLSQGEEDAVFSPWPDDEWRAIALNYTSGTTGDPKGVVFHHRGAHLAAMGNVITSDMPHFATYLWTLPMFHCNGWCFTWSLSVIAGTHVCLRRIEAGAIYNAIAKHKVSHLCGAPIIMSMLVNATDKERQPFDHTCTFMTAAAPPPAATIGRLESAGFKVVHLYGLTETYGPAVVCAWKPEWDARSLDERAAIKARQGVPYIVLDDLSVRDPETMNPVPQDGKAIGEVMFKGNVVMKGYLKNPKSTAAAMRGGWFHSGDLGVWHDDGYIQLKDRSKDIIISGGENISSIEVEDAIYRHPKVLEVAVVARDDEKWGEHPCAFITAKSGETLTEADIIAWCRDNLAHFKCPRTVVFAELPKTSTGKVQKFKLREQTKTLTS